ncbi:MAG: GNAT family N-acetyltransferase [Nanohaloarchaea archaeon]|nr:GNAT family N-acetyltransferase [Candidatus Nanohaloarchaea archaeon]
MYVDPNSQRKGAGSRLYEKIENELKDRDIEGIRLEVVSENEKGFSFYRKNGFETVNVETVELKGDEVDQKVMEKGI